MPDITLQFNLSPGDINYANVTVPALVAAHHSNARVRLAVVDCCRPQRTKIVDPDVRFPEAVFNERVERICAVTEGLRSKGYLDQVHYLRPGDPLIGKLSRKYLAGLVTETHDYGACALMSYLAGLDIPETRHVVHYDADMLIHQSPGYDWVAEAVELMNEQPSVVAASPRTSPPFSCSSGRPDAPSLHEGRPLTRVRGGWLNDWFSTRCFLMDLERLREFLPLIRGRVMFEVFAAKYLRRGYPRSPEIMLFRRVGGAGGKRLNLSNVQAWLLHPAVKSDRFFQVLPEILQAMHRGEVPEDQRGYADINLPAWEDFLLSQSQDANPSYL